MSLSPTIRPLRTTSRFVEQRAHLNQLTNLALEIGGHPTSGAAIVRRSREHLSSRFNFGHLMCESDTLPHGSSSFSAEGRVHVLKRKRDRATFASEKGRCSYGAWPFG